MVVWDGSVKRGFLGGGMTEVLYIGGYGRSGSTLLGRLLVAENGVLNLGEVAQAPGHLDSKRMRCTCGALFRDCAVWGHIDSEKMQAHKRPMPTGPHRAILRVAAGLDGVRYLVDGSKTAWGLVFRPIQLKAEPHFGITLIHLVRDPRGVAWSVLRERRRRGQEPGPLRQSGIVLRAVVGWCVANLGCSFFCILYPKQYHRIRYEDLDRKGLPYPVETLVGRRESSVKRNWSWDHALSGNRIRHHDQQDIRIDLAWRDHMPAPLRWLVVVPSSPLMLLYGLGPVDN